jgi:hypothetical protein
MKTTLTLSLVAALSISLFAQEERNPQPPQPPQPERPPLPPGEPRGPEPRRSPSISRSPDGPGLPESRRPFGGDRRAEIDFRRPSKPMPFLGVVTSHVSPVLGAQLGLPEGFGLVVDEVLPDSPAANAGVQRHDVLKLFNDQQLVDPGQLATLIRARGKDAEVSLTLLRQGQEQKVTVKISERMMPDRKPFPLGDELRRNLENLPGTVRDSLRPLQDGVKNFQDRMRDFQQRFQEWQKNPSAGPAPEVPQFEGVPDNPFGPRPIDILREARRGGAAEVKAIAGGNTSTWNTSQARVFLKDDTGEVELSSANGHRTVTAKNAQGVITFSGPVDTDEQRRALPEDIRKKVEKMEARTTTERDAPGASAKVTTEIVVEPPLEKEVQ